MYNRNHACLVSSHFSVLVERLVSVVVKCVVKDQQVGPFCSSFVYVAIKKFFNSVERIKSMDSSSTKDIYIYMLYPCISTTPAMTMYIPSIDQLPRWGSRVLTVSFPSPAQPLNLCMICEEKNPPRFPLLCGFFHFFVHPSGLVGLGSQLLGG